MCKYVIYKQPQHGFCIIYNNNIKTDTLVGRTGCKHEFPIPAEYANWTTQTQNRYIFKSYLYYFKVTGIEKRTPNFTCFARHCCNTFLVLIIYPTLARDSLYIYFLCSLSNTHEVTSCACVHIRDNICVYTDGRFESIISIFRGSFCEPNKFRKNQTVSMIFI